MATTLTVLTILVVFGFLLSRASRRTKPGGRGASGGADGGSFLVAGDGSTADGGHQGGHDHTPSPGGHAGHGAAHDGGAGSHGGDAGGGGHGSGDGGGGDGGGGHG